MALANDTAKFAPTGRGWRAWRGGATGGRGGGIAAEAGLSPGNLAEVGRGRKEVSTEGLLAVAQALGARPAGIYADLARLLGADPEQRAWPEDPPVKLRLATASLPLEALRSVADFSAYLAMANPPPKPKDRIGFHPTKSEAGP